MPEEVAQLQPEPVDNGGASEAASPVNPDCIDEVDELPEELV